jgi:sec-independent protein translocase protein TatB
VFGSLGWLEIGALLVLALLIFGPDKLPNVARDAARMLKELRAMAQGARSQIRSELGPEFADFDLDTLNPKSFVRKHLLEDEDPFAGLNEAGIPNNPIETPLATPNGSAPVPPAAVAKPAKFDPDAT